MVYYVYSMFRCRIELLDIGSVEVVMHKAQFEFDLVLFPLLGKFA
jgi:hypothetical protein